MVIYQFNNFYQIIFIVFFGVLLIVGIAASILLLPLIKLVFQNGNPVIARISLLAIVIVGYLFCISISVLSIKNISQHYSAIKETDVENCSMVTGQIEKLEKEPLYSRGANLTSYYLKFMIDDSEYCIDEDVGVTLEHIDLWNEGDCITIYYKTYEGKNIVIRAIKHGCDIVE